MEASFYFKYKHFATLKYNLIATMIVFLVFNIPTLIIFLTVPLPSHPTSATECFGYFIYIVLGQSCVQSIFLNYLVYKFWKLIDPYNIKTEFAIILGMGYVGVIAWVVLQLMDTLTGSTLFPHYFQPMYFQNSTMICIILGMIWYPIYLIYVEKKKNRGLLIYEEALPNPSDITLRTIISNEQYLQMFREVTIQYWCVESLLFVVDVERYKILLEDAQREKHARVIANNYLRSDSPLFINIPGTVATKIQERIANGDFLHTSIGLSLP